MSLSQAATEFLTGRPAGVSAVSRTVAGLLSTWVENGFNCTVRRDPSGLPYELVAERAGRGIRLVQGYTFAGGVLAGMTGDTIPTVMRSEVMTGGTFGSSVSGGLTPEQVASILEYLSLRESAVFTFTTAGSGYTATVPAGAQFCYMDIAGGGGGGGGGFSGATGGGGGGGGNAETGFSVGPFRVTPANVLTVQVGVGCNGGAAGAAGATVIAANSSIVAGLDDFGGTITYRGGREGSPGTNTNGGAGGTGGNGATSGGATGTGAGAAGTGQNSVSGAGGWYASGAGAGGGPTSNGGTSGRLTAPGYTAFQNGGNTSGTLGGGGAGGSSPWGPGGRGGDVGTNAGAGNPPAATAYGAGGGGGAGNAVGAKGADGIVRIWFV